MRLQNLYERLNLKYERKGWYDWYKEFSEDIEKIRENLSSPAHLKDDKTYEGAKFLKKHVNDKRSPYDIFIEKLLYKRANGISSSGQSILSKQNLEKIKKANDFNDVIYNIIKKPSYETYQELQDFWKRQEIGNNPLLVNRTLAACTKDVTTTADEKKFDKVFNWLQDNKYIDEYSLDENNNNNNWYHKNIFLVKELRKRLKNNKESVDDDDYWINMGVWLIYENISNPFSLKKQLVKYGPPGTGKTYLAKQNAEFQFKIWKDDFVNADSYSIENHIETVQFHPSYTYEDFIEGLRPDIDEQGKDKLILKNGIFKSFCKKAAKWECDLYKLFSNDNVSDDLKEKSFPDLLIKDLTPFKNHLSDKHWQHIFKDEKVEKRLMDAIPPYFLIIDEINRAELSRVFGELMYSLEYRGVHGAIKTQYAHLNNEETGLIKLGDGYQFFIPHNVYIIGTMNTIDRSVDTFDFALRRRFQWEEVPPDIELLKNHLRSEDEELVQLANKLEDLNDRITNEPLLGPDFQIGHAYLWNISYSRKLKIKEIKESIWEDSLEPLLQEYFRGSGNSELIKEYKIIFTT